MTTCLAWGQKPDRVGGLHLPRESFPASHPSALVLEDLEFACQPDVFRTGTNHYSELSRLDYEVHLAVPQRKVFGFQSETNGFGSPGLR